tara:strand:+ start:189 stop:536 length:348 start_codon:yes stop_codon:yes gene_type:complete
MLTVYGIPNCDKMKKIINQLKSSGFSFEFYNYKKCKPTDEHLLRWRKHLNDWPINKRGTTYRKLKEAFEVSDDANKIELMKSNASMIKRPIIENDNKVITIGDLLEFDKFLDKKI